MNKDRFNIDIAEEIYGNPNAIQAKPGAVDKSVGTPPPLIDMARSLYTETVEWAKSGFDVSQKEEAEKRLNICFKCEFFKDHRCSVCGCFMALKAKLATGKCPKGKW